VQLESIGENLSIQRSRHANRSGDRHVPLRPATGTGDEPGFWTFDRRRRDRTWIDAALARPQLELFIGPLDNLLFSEDKGLGPDPTLTLNHRVWS
jgi:hypothetical protein